MTEPSTIVVTGAHSPLGREVVRRLATVDGVRVVAVVTPWCEDATIADWPDNVTALRQDLIQPFGDDLQTALRGATRVFHLAWLREADAQTAMANNLRIVDGLLRAMDGAAALVFFSSVGASAGTGSAYGQAKWAAACRVAEAGGQVIVCGLVSGEPAFGPFRQLQNAARRLPVLPYFFASRVPVYLTDLAAVGDAAACLVGEAVAPGTYRLYDLPALDLNDLLGRLRGRASWLRVPVPTGLLLGLITVLRALRLAPVSLADKLATFLVKDTVYLNAVPALPKPTEEKSR